MAKEIKGEWIVEKAKLERYCLSELGMEHGAETLVNMWKSKDVHESFKKFLALRGLIALATDEGIDYLFSQYQS